MLINIRDDDTNYFTSVDDLRAAYGELWGKVPITLACIPFVTEPYFDMLKIDGYDRSERLRKMAQNWDLQNGEQLSQKLKRFPIGENQLLIQEIKPLIESNNLEIGLHGYEHRYFPDGAECYNRHLNRFNFIDGKKYLESVFQTQINLFIPPSNKIGFREYTYLRDSKLNLVTSSSISYCNVLEKIAFNFKRIIESPSFYIKKILRNNPSYFKALNVRVINSSTFRLNDTPASFLQRNRVSIENNQFLSIATHYFVLQQNNDYQKRFFNMLDLLDKEYGGLEFVKSEVIMNKVFSI